MRKRRAIRQRRRRPVSHEVCLSIHRRRARGSRIKWTYSPFVGIVIEKLLGPAAGQFRVIDQHVHRRVNSGENGVVEPGPTSLGAMPLETGQTPFAAGEAEMASPQPVPLPDAMDLAQVHGPRVAIALTTGSASRNSWWTG